MDENRCYGDDGYPLVDLDSDEDCRAESSDDELDVILHGTPEQKRRLRRLSLGQKSSSEDEFEKEMEQELSRTMKSITDKQNINNPGASKPKQNPAQKMFYDNDYFDSDSDEEEKDNQGGSERQKHPVISNDDLLYDPNIDEDNQVWVNNQRQGYQPKSGMSTATSSGQNRRQNKNAPKPLPHSDAVLTCPACMSVLCLDCQRHSTYKNQYRAMFVKNCKVVTDERLKFPEEKKKKQSKKDKKRNKKQKVTDSTPEAIEGNSEQGTEAMDTSCTDAEMYNPVHCNICTTEVGVYDSDEVYHFFNVLASYG